MKTVLISGANRGLGLEMVKQFAEDKWKVLAACRDPKQATQLQEMATAHADTIKILPLQVDNEESIKELSQKLKNETIDILINNAGISGSRAAEFGKLEISSWLETFRVNAISPALMAQALVHQIAQSKTKIIVNISSILGSIASNDDGGYFYYRSSKAALNMVTKSMANTLKAQQITVIAMHPGWVQTDMGGASAPLTPPQSIQGIRKVISSLTLKDSGSFVSYAGEALNW